MDIKHNPTMAGQIKTKLPLSQKKSGELQAHETFLDLNERMETVDEKNLLPPIMVASLPKSGTVFIAKSLREGLNLCSSKNDTAGMITSGAIQLDAGRFPDIFLNYSLFKAFSRLNQGVIGISHLTPNRYNLAMVSRYLDKIVVNVRDPRQAILSFTHYINELRSSEPLLISTYDFYEKYFTDSLPDQIDFQIQTWLPVFVDWIMRWVRASRDPDFGADILFTRFEDLKLNPKAYFGSILEFYGIDHTSFNLPEVPQKGTLHFRRGEIDEWRDVFNHEQAVKASSMIPETLFRTFGWTAL